MKGSVQLGLLLALATAFVSLLGFLYKQRGASAIETLEWRRPRPSLRLPPHDRVRHFPPGPRHPGWAAGSVRTPPGADSRPAEFLQSFVGHPEVVSYLVNDRRGDDVGVFLLATGEL